MHLGVSRALARFCRGQRSDDPAFARTASTIVPVATCSPWVARRLVKQPAAEIMGFEQMVKAAHRGFVGYRLTAAINPDKAAHRLRIIDRLFHRQVRHIEPVLQKVDPQHPLEAAWRAAIARLGVIGLDQGAQRRLRHDALHLGQKRPQPRGPGIALKPCHCQSQLPHSPSLCAPIHPSAHYTSQMALLQRFPNPRPHQRGPSARQSKRSKPRPQAEAHPAPAKRDHPAPRPGLEQDDFRFVHIRHERGSLSILVA
jgi:hypothetical protein